MADLTVYVREDLIKPLDRFKKKLKREGSSISSWFDERVREELKIAARAKVDGNKGDAERSWTRLINDVK